MMKRLYVAITIIICSLMPLTSVAGWSLVVENIKGSKFFIDFDRVKNHRGLVFFWELANYSRTNEFGISSHIAYYKVDCNQFRYKGITISYYAEQDGKAYKSSNYESDMEWKYPPLNSVGEELLNQGCGL